MLLPGCFGMAGVEGPGQETWVQGAGADARPESAAITATIEPEPKREGAGVFLTATWRPRLRWAGLPAGFKLAAIVFSLIVVVQGMVLPPWWVT